MGEKPSNICKTPVLLIDPASVQAFHIFNPNDWSGLSKAIVSSCAAQHGLLNYSVNKLHELFENAEKICLPKIIELKGMGVRPTQLTAYAFLTKCPNHALHPMNG